MSAALRDSNDATALLDLGGRIIDWNRAAERLYGYTGEEARAMHVCDLSPEDCRDATGDLLRRLRQGEALSESLDVQRLMKDGRTRNLWLTITLLRDSAGQPAAFVTTERDLTALSKILGTRQATQLYRHVVEELPAGAVLREHDHLTMNKMAEAITGYQRAELSTVDAWCTALHGPQARELRPYYDPRGAYERGTQPASVAIIRKDGQARHIELTACRLDDAHALWMLLDATEHDRADQALRQSEDFLRSIVSTAMDAIITIDEHGTIETFNPAAARMFGYAAAEVVGRNVSLLMPQPYRDEHNGYLSRYATTGVSRMIGTGREALGLRKDGTTFPVDIAISRIDHPLRFTGILRDLSERRQLEWRLAESQAEERRHIARELHDEIGGHMTGLGLLAQTLQAQLARAESPLAGRTRDLVKSIRDIHQQLRSVIRGIMPVDAMPEGLMGALTDLARQCESVSRIPCDFQCDAPVHVDDPETALHLFRIAREAVRNAVRHARPTAITISLGQSDSHLQVVVTDNGIGLKETPERHGGIGLASLHQRARLLGGDVSIQPRLGGGTVVSCWVPFRSTGTGANAIQVKS